MSKTQMSKTPAARRRATSPTVPASGGDAMFSDDGQSDDGQGDRQARTETKSKPKSDVIEASALTAGIECPFTDGCRGKVQVFNRGTTSVKDADGKPKSVRFQQFMCRKCNRVAEGFKVVGGQVQPGEPVYFNRVTGRME